MSTNAPNPDPNYADYFPEEEPPATDAPSTEHPAPANPADDYANYYPAGDTE